MATNNNSTDNIDSLPPHREKPRDKSGIVILAVVIIFVISAAILAMGAVPEIFRQGDTLDLQKREANAKAAQVKEILTHVDEEIDKLESNLTQLMNESENRSTASKAQRDLFDKKLDTNTAQNTKIIASLENKSKDHERQSIMMESLATSINGSLAIYGKNSIEKFNKIIENQESIDKKLNILLGNSSR